MIYERPRTSLSPWLPRKTAGIRPRFYRVNKLTWIDRARKGIERWRAARRLAKSRVRKEKKKEKKKKIDGRDKLAITRRYLLAFQSRATRAINAGPDERARVFFFFFFTTLLLMDWV